jgi:dienelactone hydrolase
MKHAILIGYFLLLNSGLCAQTLEERAKWFAYDTKLPLDVQEVSVKQIGEVKIHDITYASPKGGRVPAFLVEPSGKGPFAGIVFGNWGLGTRAEFLPEAIDYANAGAVSILVAYPWDRPAPWRKTVDNMDAPEKDREAYIQAIVDLRRAIDLLESNSKVDRSRIAYVGHSYGAQWGAIISATDRRLRTAVLMGGVGKQKDVFDSPDPDLKAYAAQIGQEKLKKYLEVVGTLDAILYVPHSAPTPLLFQFARHEKYFDEASSKRYAEAASNPKEVRWYETAHDLNDLQTYIDRARWLEKYIRTRPVEETLKRKLAVR